MLRRHSIFILAVSSTCMLVAWCAAGLAGSAAAGAFTPAAAPTPAPTPTQVPNHIASPEELLTAQAQWARSRHSSTYDGGMGANTTCAQCKAPRNWDPNAPAAESAHDCSLCKREPGKPRPQLTGGVPVEQNMWQNITCDICHQPSGNSYYTGLSFWNQNLGKYEVLSTSADLCSKCHSEQHGFQVIFEQTTSPAHNGWDCTRCHGSHNSPVKCTDCHDPTRGRGADAHSLHPNVGCTTCHDAGGLAIWQDPFPTSRFYRIYMPQRMAHDLRSWPSHNLQAAADCRRCHHPQGTLQITLAANVRCDNKNCHPDGASFYWCPIFPRDEAPKVKSP